MTTPKIVPGAVSTISDLGKDEVWLQGWLREEPTRLGLGELEATDGPDDDERSFTATDEDRCFSVDVQLGELEASRGFQVLDNWARNRVIHPDKTHVAVLVTEAVSDRYETTLQTLAEHLPLVVVELQVWRGEDEAIVVPHVALSSDEVDLSATPAAKAAEAVAGADDATEIEDDADAAEPEPAEAQEVEAETEASDDAEAEVPDNKDDTGVTDPWGLPASEPEAVGADSNGSSGQSLLSKFGD